MLLTPAMKCSTTIEPIIDQPSNHNDCILIVIEFIA